MSTYKQLEEDLAKQGMHLMVQAATPGLRFRYGYWHLTEKDCKSDVILVQLPAHHNWSQVRMAEGIVNRHFPGYVLTDYGRHYNQIIKFARRPFQKK